MKQAARELTACDDGFLNGKKRLIMDRDASICESLIRHYHRQAA
jgi:hypothetical protein